MDVELFESRKRDHIRLALDPKHQAIEWSDLARIELVHEALPELNLNEISLAAPCLGKTLATPFYIAGMTAGHPGASDLNVRLARACERRGWALGVGSQRRELDVEGAGATLDRWARLREEAPGVFLMANLGLAQLIPGNWKQVRSVIEGAGAQALCIHLNALQEVLQPEGTPQFKGGLEAIRQAVLEAGVPVVVKETGCGISGTTAERLQAAGVAAIDVSGAGGTHWGRIEGSRAAPSSSRERASQVFAGWGIPTARSVQEVHRAAGKAEIWASGGVRSGLDAAKLVALGAHRVGYAQPALEVALAGEEDLDRWMESQEFELRISLFCTGSPGPESLRGKEKACLIAR